MLEKTQTMGLEVVSGFRLVRRVPVFITLLTESIVCYAVGISHNSVLWAAPSLQVHRCLYTLPLCQNVLQCSQTKY